VPNHRRGEQRRSTTVGKPYRCGPRGAPDGMSGRVAHINHLPPFPPAVFHLVAQRRDRSARTVSLRASTRCTCDAGHDRSRWPAVAHLRQSRRHSGLNRSTATLFFSTVDRLSHEPPEAVGHSRPGSVRFFYDCYTPNARCVVVVSLRDTHTLRQSPLRPSHSPSISDSPPVTWQRHVRR
jgi:hypothetical protein